MGEPVVVAVAVGRARGRLDLLLEQRAGAAAEAGLVEAGLIMLLAVAWGGWSRARV